MFLLTKGLFIFFTGVGALTYLACRYNGGNCDESSKNVTGNVNGNGRFSSSSGSPSSSINCNCKKIHECNGRNRIRGQFCGFDGFVRKICCEDDPDESRRTKSILDNPSAANDSEVSAREAYLRLLASHSADSVASLITRLSTTTRATATKETTTTTSTKPPAVSTTTTTTFKPQLNEIEALLAIPKAVAFSDTSTTTSTTEGSTRMTQSPGHTSSTVGSTSHLHSGNAISSTIGNGNGEVDILSILGLHKEVSNFPNENSVPLDNPVPSEQENETNTGRKVGGTIVAENKVLRTNVEVAKEEKNAEALGTNNTATTVPTLATTAESSTLPEESFKEEEHNDEEPIGISVDGEVTFSPLNLDILEVLSLKKSKELSVHNPTIISLESTTTESSDTSEVSLKDKEIEPSTTKLITPELNSGIPKDIKTETTKNPIDLEEIKLETTTQRIEPKIAAAITENVNVETTTNPAVLPDETELKASTDKTSTELPSSIQDNISGEVTKPFVDFPDENESDATTQITVTDLNSINENNTKIESQSSPAISLDEKEIQTTTQTLTESPSSTGLEKLITETTKNPFHSFNETEMEFTTSKLPEEVSSTTENNSIKDENASDGQIATTETQQATLQSEQSDSVGENVSAKHEDLVEELNSTNPPGIQNDSSSVLSTSTMKIETTSHSQPETTENFQNVQIEDLVSEKIEVSPQKMSVETTTQLSSIDSNSANANIPSTTTIIGESAINEGTTLRAEPISEVQESFDIIESDSIKKGNISAAESLVKDVNDLEHANDDENDIEMKSGEGHSDKKPVSQGANETDSFPIIAETSSSTVASMASQPNTTDIDTEGEKDANGSTPHDILINSSTSESVSFADVSDTTTQISTGASALPPVEEGNELYGQKNPKSDNDTETLLPTEFPSISSDTTTVLTNANEIMKEESEATTINSEILSPSNLNSHEGSSATSIADETTHETENPVSEGLGDIENATDVNNEFSTTSSSGLNRNASDNELIDKNIDLEDELKKNFDDSLINTATEAVDHNLNSEDNVTDNSVTNIQQNIDSTNKNLDATVAATTVIPSTQNNPVGTVGSDFKSEIDSSTTQSALGEINTLSSNLNESNEKISNSNIENNESETNDSSFARTTSLPDDLIPTEIPMNPEVLNTETLLKSATEISRSTEKEASEDTTINNLDVINSSASNATEETVKDDSVINIEDFLEGMITTTENSSINDVTSQVSPAIGEEQNGRSTTEAQTLGSSSIDGNEGQEESTTQILSLGKSNSNSESEDEFPLETTPSNIPSSTMIDSDPSLNVTEISTTTETAATENSSAFNEMQDKDVNPSDANDTLSLLERDATLKNEEDVLITTTTDVPHLHPSNNVSESFMLNITEIIPEKSEKSVKAEEKSVSSENNDDIIFNELDSDRNLSDKNVVMNLLREKSSKSIDDDFSVTTTEASQPTSGFNGAELKIVEILEQSTEMPVTENSSDKIDILSLLMAPNISTLTTNVPNYNSSELNITEIFGTTSEMPLTENSSDDKVVNLIKSSSKNNEEESDFSITTTNAPHLHSSNIVSELNVTELLGPTSEMPLSENSSDDNVVNLSEASSKNNEDESDFQMTTTIAPQLSVGDSELNITEIARQSSEMHVHENSSDDNVTNLVGVTSKNNEEESDLPVTTTNTPYYHSSNSNVTDSDLDITEIVGQTSEMPLNENFSDDLVEGSSKNNEEESDFVMTTTMAPHLLSSNLSDSENVTEIVGQTSEMPLNENFSDNLVEGSSKNNEEESDFVMTTTMAPHLLSSNLSDSELNVTEMVGTTSESPIEATQSDILNALREENSNKINDSVESDDEFTTTMSPPYLKSSNDLGESELNSTEAITRTSEMPLGRNFVNESVTIMNLLSGDILKDDDTITTTNAPYFHSENSSDSQSEVIGETTEIPINDNSNEIDILNLLKGDSQEDHNNLNASSADSVTEGVSPSANQNETIEYEDNNHSNKSETNLFATTESNIARNETKDVISTPLMTDEESFETTTEIPRNSVSMEEQSTDPTVELGETTLKTFESANTTQDNFHNTSSTDSVGENDIESRTEETTTIAQDEDIQFNDNKTEGFDNISKNTSGRNITEENSLRLDTNTEEPLEGVTESYKEIATTNNPEGSMDDSPVTTERTITNEENLSPSELQDEEINNATETSVTDINEIQDDRGSGSGEQEFKNQQGNETQKSSGTVSDVTERVPEDEEIVTTTEKEMSEEGTTQSSLNDENEENNFSTTIETPTTRRVIISSVNEIQRVSFSQSRQETKSMSSSVSILDLLTPPSKLFQTKNATNETNIVNSSNENKDSFLDDMTTPSGGTVIFSDENEGITTEKLPGDENEGITTEKLPGDENEGITTEKLPGDEMMETTTMTMKPTRKPTIIKIGTVNEIKRVSSSQSRYETRSQISTNEKKPKRKETSSQNPTTDNSFMDFDTTTTSGSSGENEQNDESGDSSATTIISADDGESMIKLSPLDRTGKNLLYKDDEKSNDVDSKSKLSWNLADFHPYDKEPHVHYSIESSSTSKSIARIESEFDTKINPITTTESPSAATTPSTVQTKIDPVTETSTTLTSSLNNTEESVTETEVEDEIPATTESVAPDALEFINSDKTVETDYETTVRNSKAESEPEMTTNSNSIKDDIDMSTTMNSVIFPEEYGTSTVASDIESSTDLPQMDSTDSVPKNSLNVEIEKELERNNSKTVPVMASTQTIVDYFQIERTSTTTEKPFDIIVEESDELNEIEAIIRRVRNEIKTLSLVKETDTENKNSTEKLDTAASELNNLITFANELDKLYEEMKKEKQVARKEKILATSSTNEANLKKPISKETVINNDSKLNSNKPEISVPIVENVIQNNMTKAENFSDVNVGTPKPAVTNLTGKVETTTEVSSEKDFRTENAFLIDFIHFLRKENAEIDSREKEHNDVTTTEHQSTGDEDDTGSTQLSPTSEKYISDDTTLKINNDFNFINDGDNIQETSTGFKETTDSINSSIEDENAIVSHTTISQDNLETPETTTQQNSQEDIILNEKDIKTKKLAVGNLQWKLQPSVQLLVPSTTPSTEKGLLTTTESPLTTTTVTPSTTVETTTTTTKIPEPEITLDINVGPPHGRALENSFDDIQENLKGKISHVVTQLLLTSHQNFHLLPNFVQCASAKFNKPKTKVLSHSVGTLDTDNYPWMARIGYREEGGVAFSCSGSVISKRYIMTSAYCASKSSQSLMEILLENGNSADSVKYEIEKVILHEDYNATTRENDIALIRVTKDFDFSEDSEVRPICLPFEDAYGIWDSLPKDGENAYIAGWGFTQNAMKNATVKIWPMENCTEAYFSDADKVLDSSTQICAQGSLNEDSCRGDNGSSMMAVMTNREIFFQIGVVSYGPRCGYDVPSVYTRVYAYLPWILQSIDS